VSPFSHIKAFIRTPARLSLLAFAVTIGIGSLLLSLPASSSAEPLSFMDALFTSTSATCVTGLVVVDTGTRLSLFGQLVVLLLIQAGGLGIMTLSTAFLVATRRRPSLTGLAAVHDALPPLKQQSYGNLLLEVVKMTFLLEGLGALVLSLRFLFDHPFWQAVYLGVFHAVSAFCNAGFSPFSNSLVSYSGDWVVNLCVAALIVSGGIGFVVLAEARHQRPWRRGGWRRLSLNSRLVLVTSAVLIAVGTTLVLLCEWNNTLAAMPWHQRLLAALFQSITARTAGFNTVPTGQLANETLFLLMLLMFIGASSGSCGGGIKTGTFAALLVWGLSRLRGQQRPQVFRRSLAESSLARAISVTMVSAAIVVAAVMMLLLIEVGGVSHQASRGTSMELMFEAVSAFGTVGLSTGITTLLSSLGKFVLVLVMFTGRLGPLVVAMAIGRTKLARYRYAEEQILVG